MRGVNGAFSTSAVDCQVSGEFGAVRVMRRLRLMQAKHKSIQLPLNSAISVYACALQVRGTPDQACNLLFSCLEMAKRHKYQLKIRRVGAALHSP